MKINEINWVKMWEAERAQASAKQNVEKWDAIAERQSRWTKKEEYPKKLIPALKLRPYWTALDVGCGTGILTLPLAARAKNVTALDFSDVMLGFLKEKADREKVRNIRYVNKGWDKAVPGKDVAPHDVVIASRFVYTNLWNDLAKMNEVARRYVYVTERASVRNFDKAVYVRLGRPYNELPSYIYHYNILYQMGIYANVQFIRTHSRICYRGIEDAMDDWRWKLGTLRRGEETVLREHLLRNLTETPEGTLEALNENTTWALLWWRKV